MNAPRSVVFVIGPAWNRYPTPTRYPPLLKTKRSDAWLRRQPIPQPRFDRDRIESMKRRVQEKLRGNAMGVG
jgi:hypothetical protein